MKDASIKKMMVFGRPGSGKSTFASWVATALNLPLHHLDKHFFTENWKERNYSEFLQIQQNIVDGNAWIVDGNSTQSLEMRWSKADLVLYFNFSKIICIFRLFKRIFKPNKAFDDRAPKCPEIIRWRLLKYTWHFEKRVDKQIEFLKAQYPRVIFKEIKNDTELNKLKTELMGQ